MAQQISIEAALESYKERAATLLHENVLLTARVSELEAQSARLAGENSGLRDQVEAAADGARNDDPRD